MASTVPHNQPVKLGFLPLLDCAPLVVAQELGFFRQEGLLVQLERESSWATVRDKVVYGLLDGAHMLAPMPLASSLGLGTVRKPLICALSLGLNGNAISLSTPLFETLKTLSGQAQPTAQQAAKALKRHLEQRNLGKPLALATVFPFSMHNYQLRHWLALGGIDPDVDLKLVVVPPALMVSALSQGDINGFCVGEPYNAIAVRAGVGRIALTGHDVWGNAPEKVFGVTADWAEAHPETHHRVLRALLRACRWLDEPENRRHLPALLARHDYMDVDEATLTVAVAQMSADQHHGHEPEWRLPCTHKHFYHYGATVPSLSHARRIADQLVRWRQYDVPIHDAELANIYRPDIYDSVAQTLGYATVDAQISSEPPLPE